MSNVEEYKKLEETINLQDILKKKDEGEFVNISDDYFNAASMSEDQKIKFLGFIDYLKQNNKILLLETILNYEDEEKNLLCLEIENNASKEYIEALLEITNKKGKKWFDINQKCRGKTPLIYAIDKENAENAENAENDENIAIIELLLTKGANVNLTNIYNKWPIEIACKKGLSKVVNILKPKYTQDQLEQMDYHVDACTNTVSRGTSRVFRFARKVANVPIQAITSLTKRFVGESTSQPKVDESTSQPKGGSKRTSKSKRSGKAKRNGTAKRRSKNAKRKTHK
jgi:hypothetical protein